MVICRHSKQFVNNNIYRYHWTFGGGGGVLTGKINSIRDVCKLLHVRLVMSLELMSLVLSVWSEVYDFINSRYTMYVLELDNCR